MSKSKKNKKNKKSKGKVVEVVDIIEVPKTEVKPKRKFSLAGKFDFFFKEINPRKIFLRWMILACTMVCVSMMTYHAGYYDQLKETDSTKISFVLLMLLAYNTTKLGFASVAADKEEEGTEAFVKKVETPLRFAKFSANASIGIGFIGTIIGAIMLLAFFGTVDITNLVTVQNLIVAIPMKMGVAFYTTLVGLIAALLIQIQCFNIEINYPDEKE
jgi:hypothetical protein